MAKKVAKKVTKKRVRKNVERGQGLMNNIRACADEIVLNDIVYS